jgi:hypothetical protein
MPFFITDQSVIYRPIPEVCQENLRRYNASHTEDILFLHALLRIADFPLCGKWILLLHYAPFRKAKSPIKREGLSADFLDSLGCLLTVLILLILEQGHGNDSIPLNE